MWLIFWNYRKIKGNSAEFPVDHGSAKVCVFYVRFARLIYLFGGC